MTQDNLLIRLDREVDNPLAIEAAEAIRTRNRLLFEALMDLGAMLAWYKPNDDPFVTSDVLHNKARVTVTEIRKVMNID